MLKRNLNLILTTFCEEKSGTQVLDLRRFQLNSPQIKSMITGLMATQTLQILQLRHVHFDATQAEAFIHALSQNTSLHTLELDACDFHHEKIKAVFIALIRHPNLIDLRINLGSDSKQNHETLSAIILFLQNKPLLKRFSLSFSNTLPLGEIEIQIMEHQALIRKIPINLFNCKDLEKLKIDLSILIHCKIQEGLLPLRNLMELKIETALALSTVDIIRINEILKHCPPLKALHLSHIALNEKKRIPIATVSGKALSDAIHASLDIVRHRNEFASSLIKAHQSLQILSIRHARLNSVFDSWLGELISGLPNLTTLDLTHNALGERAHEDNYFHFIHAVTTHPKLRDIDLSHNCISTHPVPLLMRHLDRSHVERLNLSHNTIGESYRKEASEAISRALQVPGTPLKSLNLSHNKIDVRSISTLLRGITHPNPSLTQLDLGNNQSKMDKAEYATSIAMAFQNASLSQIHEINLDNIEFNEHVASLLFSALPMLRELKSLSMASCKLNSDSIEDLCEFLATSNSLQKINLANNAYSFSDGLFMLSAISSPNNKMHHLDLMGGSRISSEPNQEEVSLLESYLARNYRLTYIDLGYSNHTVGMLLLRNKKIQPLLNLLDLIKVTIRNYLLQNDKNLPLPDFVLLSHSIIQFLKYHNLIDEESSSTYKIHFMHDLLRSLIEIKTHLREILPQNDPLLAQELELEIAHLLSFVQTIKILDQLKFTSPFYINAEELNQLNKLSINSLTLFFMDDSFFHLARYIVSIYTKFDFSETLSNIYKENPSLFSKTAAHFLILLTACEIKNGLLPEDLIVLKSQLIKSLSRTIMKDELTDEYTTNNNLKNFHIVLNKIGTYFKHFLAEQTTLTPQLASHTDRMLRIALISDAKMLSQPENDPHLFLIQISPEMTNEAYRTLSNTLAGFSPNALLLPISSTEPFIEWAKKLSTPFDSPKHAINVLYSLIELMDRAQSLTQLSTPQIDLFALTTPSLGEGAASTEISLNFGFWFSPEPTRSEVLRPNDEADKDEAGPSQTPKL